MNPQNGYDVEDIAVGGKVVIDGEAMVMVSSRAKRAAGGG